MLASTLSPLRRKRLGSLELPVAIPASPRTAAAVERAEEIGRRLSLLLGLPVGTTAVLATLALTSCVTDEKIFAIYLRFFGDATAWLLLVFPLALRVASTSLGRGLAVANPASLRLGARYALTVNLVIWSTYILVATISTTGQVRGLAFLLSTLALPVGLFAVSVALTPFTVGRVIANAVTRALKAA